MANSISIEVLHQLLHYDPLTGILTWKSRPAELFSHSKKQSQDTSAARWNARFAGKRAFTRLNKEGYYAGEIFYVEYGAQRICWALHTGRWPEDEIDHENHDRGDNRFENLKEATRKENQKNKSLFKNNKSGYHGIWNDKKSGRWKVSIRSEGKIYHLGYFKEKADAIAARKEAEVKYGFNPNHGMINNEEFPSP